MNRSDGRRWLMRKYGLTEAEVLPLPQECSEDVLEAVEKWREANGLPADTSPLTRGYARDLIQGWRTRNVKLDTKTLRVCGDCRQLIANGDLTGAADDYNPDKVDDLWPKSEGWHLCVEDGEKDEHSIDPCQACGDRRHGERWPATAYREARFLVGRNDGRPFHDGDEVQWRRPAWFKTEAEAAAFIDRLPDKAAVDRGDFYIDDCTGAES